LENLKLIRSLGWHFFTRLKKNRLVNPDERGNVPISEVQIPKEGRIVHLKGYGMMKVFRTASRNGDAEYWATDDLGMGEGKKENLYEAGWEMEVYHRGIKQCYGVEGSHVRKAVSIINIAMSLRAF